MSISTQVKGIMLGAMASFANENKVETNNIQLMVNARGNCKLDPSQIGINYFYCVNGRPKLNNDLEIKNLDFTKDVLQQKADLANFGFLAADFFRKKIQLEAKELDIEVSDIEIAFVWAKFKAKEEIDGEVKEIEKEDLLICIMNSVTKARVKVTTLEAVFGEQ